ncbi:ATP-binding protein [Sphaerisporangium fuscum]|uniref:ATP-binding protein n=1 Tax=Sphaerisporangium fuscum TaxID=2835868 RepID=UPI001BDD2251|nr:ATP-binding protein [Sphaerisporangium fuscum]
MYTRLTSTYTAPMTATAPLASPLPRSPAARVLAESALPACLALTCLTSVADRFLRIHTPAPTLLCRPTKHPPKLLRRLGTMLHRLPGPVRRLSTRRPRRASWVLSEDFRSIPVGRSLIRSQLADWGHHDQSEIAELLAGELLANALRHAWGAPVLRLRSAAGTLRCEVEDGNPEPPTLAVKVDAYDETGRGMHLVDLLSRRWGVEGRDRGKTVWFELPVYARRPWPMGEV